MAKIREPTVNIRYFVESSDTNTEGMKNIGIKNVNKYRSFELSTSKK
jgi:hypothetical protein